MKLLLLSAVLVGCRNNIKPLEEETGDFDAVDQDGDGYFEDDCDDNNPNVYPGVEEICDGVDNDCDGDVDEDVKDQFYLDADGDGFGDENSVELACDSPVGYVPNGNDCDDQDVYSFPGALEFCDEVDNDCDGDIDEEVTLTFYLDADGDGVGNGDISIDGCEVPEGYVSENGDCDDDNPLSYPSALELCDDLDNDCDGDVDEDSSINVLPWYEDADEDGAGDINTMIEACAPPEGYIADSSDCDDTNSNIHPNATEYCDSIDNDCDGDIDDDDSSVVGTQTWYLDHDGDSFGDGAWPLQRCTQPSGYVGDSTDCNDLSAFAFPGGLEVCDGLDNDCDGDIDDADVSTDTTTMQTFYADVDGDGFGDDDNWCYSVCLQPAIFSVVAIVMMLTPTFIQMPMNIVTHWTTIAMGKLMKQILSMLHLGILIMMVIHLETLGFKWSPVANRLDMSVMTQTVMI